MRGRRFRIRTLTAGVTLASIRDLEAVQDALLFLQAARRSAEAAGYEVQTIRVATNPLLRDSPALQRATSLPHLIELDRLAVDGGAVVAIGPVFSAGHVDAELAAWARELVCSTRATSFSVTIATPEHGVHAAALKAAADIILALSDSLPGGVGNFRFAAAANVPAGTPFFPTAHHQGEPALSIGLETPGLVSEAVEGAKDGTGTEERLRERLDAELRPVEQLFTQIARDGGHRYLGIDTSPAPGPDSSIGHAIELLSGAPFGAPSTLQACATITAAIKSLRVQTCGYSGLMLPVLEDAVLAARAAQGRIGLNELLLFSSVCGTGLDVVPLPGDVSSESLQRVLADVATLATRLRKPLSARLFPMPGKGAGDTIDFDDPLLFASRVLPVQTERVQSAKR